MENGIGEDLEEPYGVEEIWKWFRGDLARAQAMLLSLRRRLLGGSIYSVARLVMARSTTAYSNEGSSRYFLGPRRQDSRCMIVYQLIQHSMIIGVEMERV